MKPLYYLLILIAAASCKKEKIIMPPQQDMEIKELNETEIGYNQGKRFDLDGNGTYDMAFTTYHIGDPLLQMDKIQFCAVSMIDSYLPINNEENVSVLSLGDKVYTNSQNGYNWYEVSLIVLAQKNIPLNGAIHWMGPWQQSSHNYLPVQLKKEGKRFNGWVELSFDKEREKIILHRSAISKIPEMDIQIR